MNRIIVHALAFLFLPAFALANPLTSWLGSGHSTNGSWWVKDCPTVAIQLAVENNKLWVKSGGYLCGDIGVRYVPFSYDVVGSEIFKDGKKIGLITKDRIELRSPRAQNGFWIMKISVGPDGKAHFIDRQEEASGYYFEVTGSLDPQ